MIQTEEQEQRLILPEHFTQIVFSESPLSSGSLSRQEPGNNRIPSPVMAPPHVEYKDVGGKSFVHVYFVYILFSFLDLKE